MAMRRFGICVLLYLRCSVIVHAPGSDADENRMERLKSILQEVDRVDD